MAILPSKYNLSGPSSLRSGRAIASQDTTAIGRGIAQAGNALVDISNEMKQREDALGLAKAEAEKSQGLIQTSRSFDNDPDYATFGDRAPKVTGDIVNRAAQNIKDPNLRARWIEGAKTDAVRTDTAIMNKADALGQQATQASVDETLEAQRRIYVDPATTDDEKAKALSDIQGTIDVATSTGIFSPAEAAKRRQDYIENAYYSRGKLLAENQPDVITRPMPPDAQGRASAAVAYFQSQGWSKEQAAGIVGNLMAESTLNTTARNRGDGNDGSDSIGIGQWNGARAKALRDFAAANGKDWHDFETQLAFVNHELKTSEASAGNALKAARNVDEATAAFIGYERPAGWSANNPRGGHNYKGRLNFASQAAGIDPNPEWFRRMSPEQREAVYETAENVQTQRQAQQRAQEKAYQNSVVDDFNLRIATRDLTLTTQDILSNSTIDTGQKAALINSYNSAMKDANTTAIDLGAIQSGTFSGDPYSSEFQKRNDNVADFVMKNVPDNQQASFLQGMVAQSGYVPQPILNRIRAGVDSQSPGEVEAALQLAYRFSQINPSALGRATGGEAVQRKVDDFDYYVNTLNLSPSDAARRIAEQNDPNKVRDRKALEPAAKEFRKQMEGADIGAIFDESTFGWRSNPNVGFTEGQAAGIAADYTAIAEEQFYATGGNAELAKARADQEMKRLYGVTEIGGSRTVMKYPPERFWPSMPGASDPYAYVKDQLINDLAEAFPEDATLNPKKNGSGFIGTVDGKTVDIRDGSGLPEYRNMVRDNVLSRVILVATPETGAEVKTNQLPGYTVLYKDEQGNLQTLYGKQWRPDPKAVSDEARQLQADRLGRAQTYQQTGQGIADYLNGGDIPMGAGAAWDNPETQTTPNPTVQGDLSQQRSELFQNARNSGVLTPETFGNGQSYLGAARENSPLGRAISRKRGN